MIEGLNWHIGDEGLKRAPIDAEVWKSLETNGSVGNRKVAERILDQLGLTPYIELGPSDEPRSKEGFDVHVVTDKNLGGQNGPEETFVLVVVRNVP